jgi:hypothetical protein
MGKVVECREGSTGFGAQNEPVEPKRTVKGYGSHRRAVSQGQSEWEK